MHDRHSRQRDTRGVAGHIDLVYKLVVFTLSAALPLRAVSTRTILTTVSL